MTGSGCRPSESGHPERAALPPPLPLYQDRQGRLSGGPGGSQRWAGLGGAPGSLCQRIAGLPRECLSHTAWRLSSPCLSIQQVSGWEGRPWGGIEDLDRGQGARKDAFPPPGSSSCRCHGYVCFLFDSSQTAEGGVPAPSSGHRCVGLFTTAACGIPRKRLQTGHPAAAKYPGVKS